MVLACVIVGVTLHKTDDGKGCVLRKPILLLDEVTSALDMETEKRLLSNLREMTDRTVVIVTHRPAALEICDRVVEFTEKALEDQD